MNHNRKVLYSTFRLFAVVTTPLINAVSAAPVGEVIEVNQVTIASGMSFPAQPPFQPIVFSESPTAFAKPVAAAQQRFQDFVPVGYAPTTGPMRFAQPPDQFAKPVAASLQRFEDLGPFQSAKLVPWVGDVLSSKFVPPLSASQQRFPDFVPQGTIVSVTPQGGYYEGFSLQFAKPYAVTLQRYPDFAPFPAPVTGIVSCEETVVINSLALVSACNWAPPPPTAGAATPGPLQGINPYPEQFGRPYPAQLQRFPDFVPQGTIVSTTPQGGYYEGLSFRFACPFLDKQFGPFVVPAAFQPVTFVQWPEQFAKPYVVTLQRFPDLAPFAPAAATLNGNGAAGYETVVIKRRTISQFGCLPLSLQATATPGPLQGINPYPEQFAKPFPAQAQRWPDFVPQGTIVSTTPQGGYYEGLSFRFVCPVIDRGLAGFVVPAAFRPAIFIQWPERFAQAYPVTQQQASAFPIVTGAATPSAFGFSQSPERFATFYPATQQLASASFGFNPGAPTVTPTTLGGNEFPVVFTVPLNASQQLTSAWGNFIPSAVTAMFTVSGSEVKDRFPTTSVSYSYEIPYGVSSNISRRTN